MVVVFYADSVHVPEPKPCLALLCPAAPDLCLALQPAPPSLPRQPSPPGPMLKCSPYLSNPGLLDGHLDGHLDGQVALLLCCSAALLALLKESPN
jgi:hypothetical protein